MGRNHIHKNRDKNKQKLPQVPDALKGKQTAFTKNIQASLLTRMTAKRKSVRKRPTTERKRKTLMKTPCLRLRQGFLHVGETFTNRRAFFYFRRFVRIARLYDGG